MKSTFHKIGHRFGRRAYERFSVQGAIVSWSYADHDCSSDETAPLSDISRIGLSLLTNNPPTVNSDVTIRVHLPKEPDPIELRGRTIYAIQRGPGLTYEYRVGIQLRPFSEGEGDNSLQSLEVIEKLEQIYGKKLEDQDIEDIED